MLVCEFMKPYFDWNNKVCVALKLLINLFVGPCINNSVGIKCLVYLMTMDENIIWIHLIFYLNINIMLIIYYRVFPRYPFWSGKAVKYLYFRIFKTKGRIVSFLSYLLVLGTENILVFVRLHILKASFHLML